MTFMESIYTELKDNHITTNSEDFSKRFLRKSPHYYSAMKSKGSDATTDVLIDLATAMFSDICPILSYIFSIFPYIFLLSSYIFSLSSHISLLYLPYTYIPH